MGKFVDLTGQKFGEWLVISKSEQRSHSNKILWKCKCSCGTERLVESASLKSGKSFSCGCKAREKTKIRNKTISRRDDLTGQKFNRWTVLEYAGKNTSNAVMWKCRCDCGTIKNVTANSLKNGMSKSCGCLHKEKSRQQGLNKRLKLENTRIGHLTIIEYLGASLWKCKCECGNIIEKHTHSLTGHNNDFEYLSCGCTTKPKNYNHLNDLTGKKFDRLTVQSFAYSKNGARYWNCVCECGKTKIVKTNSLTTGNIRSCGCLFLDIMKERGEKKKGLSVNDIIDLKGQKFGKLTAIEFIGLNKHNKALWKCSCECGGEHIAESRGLRLGHVKSCPRCTAYTGELKIKELCEFADLKFEMQKRFNTCRYKNPLPFDFYIKEQYLIEYDGIQHFKVGYRGSNEQDLEKRQYMDNIKNNWCKENNIPLIRIPYWKLDTLCIEDLMLETTEFRVA